MSSGVHGLERSCAVAKTGAGIDQLIAEIAERAQSAVGAGTEPALTRVRHREALENALEGYRRLP